MFQGSLVALVTPFRDGAVDAAALDDLCRFHLENGTRGIVPLGTTGESPTLDGDERALVLKTVVARCRGRMPVIAGTGTNDTRKSIALTKQARELGADAALLVTPYYNKPTQEGMFRHFEAIARQGGLPVVLYNIPGRSAAGLTAETVARLAQVPGVVAVKESTGNVEMVTQIRALCDVTILSGDDSLTLPILALGGAGVVSVLANLLPRETAALCDALRAGAVAEARARHDRLFPLMKALFLETNPIPVKTAMKLLGRGNGELRLPLCEMAPANVEKLAAALRAYGLAVRA